MFRLTRLFPGSLLAVVVSVCLLHAAGSAVFAEEGAWSRNSFLLPAQDPFRVPSPDRTKTAFVEGTKLAVLEGRQNISGLEGFSLMGQAELAWSPDSKAFVVTASEGGTDGPWFITVFQIQNQRVTLREPVGEVIAKFHGRYPCLGQDDPNVGALWWTKGSSQLLIGAEVPERSHCAEAGQRRGYIVDVSSGKVLYEFDATSLKENFSEHLGRRFSRPSRD